MNDPKCPKCSHTMERGFLFDRAHGDYGQPGDWVEGVPRKSFWFGTIVHGRAKHEITTFRCTSCGFLESYALEDKKD